MKPVFRLFIECPIVANIYANDIIKVLNACRFRKKQGSSRVDGDKTLI